MTLSREGEYITVTINNQSETMHISEWSRITSRPGRIETFGQFSFARGTPDQFSTDEYNEPPCA